MSIPSPSRVARSSSTIATRIDWSKLRSPLLEITHSPLSQFSDKLQLSFGFLSALIVRDDNLKFVVHFQGEFLARVGCYPTFRTKQ